MENKSTGSPASAQGRSWMNASLSPDERAALVLAQLTLDEKVSMVHGKSNDAYAMAAIAHLGMPALTMTDGPAGITAARAVALAAPTELAAPWDLRAAEQYGELLGREAQATGHTVYLAPFLDLARDP